MSRNKKLERNNRNFANIVLNHTDNNNNSDQAVNNLNFEFATEDEAQFMKYHKKVNFKDQT